MRNEEYGITAIKLIFTVIILAVIIGAGVFFLRKTVSDNNVIDIKTDLLYIQGKVKVMYDKKIVNDEEILLGEEINEYSENEDINAIVSEEEGWYKLNQEDLNTIGRSKLKEKDGYLVNYKNADVIYCKGIIENDNKYYRISDLNKKDEEVEQESNEENIENTENEENESESTENNENSENSEVSE